MESKVTFRAKGLDLEGRLYEGAGPKGAIVTHPHPLYGGDMDNAVVVALAQTYQEAGWSTLRFNFRGAGRSQGNFDNGVGEQEDIQAAIAFLQAQGAGHIQLAGYSFGAWVLARWCQQYNHADHPIFLVSPPLAFIEFPIGPLPGLKAVVTGRRDDLAPPALVKKHLNRYCPDIELTIIEKADHFFWDHMDELSQTFNHCVQRYGSNGTDAHPA